MVAAPVHLEWVAPAGCPSQVEVLSAVERMLDASDASSAVDARVIVAQEEQQFRADLVVTASGATSTRSLTGESCRAIADAATLVIALAAQPDANPPPPPSPASPAPATVSYHAPATEPPRVLFFQLSFLVDAGSLPSVGPGGEVAFGWSPARWDFEVLGTFLGPQRATTASAPTVGAHLWLAHAGVRGCYALFGTQLDLGPCLGGGFDWITAHGFGAAPDRPANATAMTATSALGGRVVLRVSSRVFLRLVAEGVLPWARPPFVIEGGGQVFRASAGSLRAAVGAEVHF